MVSKSCPWVVVSWRSLVGPRIVVTVGGRGLCSRGFHVRAWVPVVETRAGRGMVWSESGTVVGCFVILFRRHTSSYGCRSSEGRSEGGFASLAFRGCRFRCWLSSVVAVYAR